MHSHLHFLVFSLLFFPSLGQQQAPPPSSSSSSAASNDVRSLLEFKKGIQADPSGLVLDTWVHSASPLGSDGCPRSWHGVNCDDAGSVVAISLNGLGLAGELKFSTLTAMASLKTLSLSNNSFTGRLVPALGSITSLQHLDLSGNHFYGPIPGRIADLWGLVHLNLSSNNFTGGFPGGIRNLQQLRVLDLRWNGLWGDVRMLLSELRNPEYVDLSGNAFYGELQMDSGNLSSLANTVRYVNMSWNKLNGGFFSGESLRMFHNLELLDVGHNQITGELPSLDSLTNLKVLRAGNNMLYGSLPEVLFGNAMSVTELDLSRNGFTGSIFSINSTSLKVLNLSSNALSGPLPPSTGSCIIVDLSKNMITGDLAPIQSWGDLETIDLSSNLLSGNFPNSTSQFVALTSIKIKNNSIVGVLPSVLGSYPRLSDIDFSMNKLTGPLLPSLLTSLTLTSLNLSGNHFTGTIPLQSPHSTESLVLPSYTHMEFLDLSDNSLSGSLPPEIVNLQRLKLLDLGMNSLSGQIPTEINKLSSLEFLDLSQNQLKGTIPDLFQSSLKVFNVSNNDLSGLVPQNLKRFPSASFFPGNALLIFPDGPLSQHGGSGVVDNEGHHHHLKSRLRVALIIGSIGAVVLILFTFMAVYKIRSQELCGRSKFRGQIPGRDVKLGRFSRPNIFRSHKNDSVPMSMSFSNDHLLTSASRSMSGQKELVTETVECVFSDSRDAGSEPTKVGVLENCPPTGGWKSSPGSPLASSPHFVDPLVSEQPVVLDVHSPDRLVGELFFLDTSLVFTAEDLSRAPAEVLGRSSHGTSYKATLDDGHMLTVKWLRVGLVKCKKEFAKEAKRIGAIKHPNIISLRGYYWGPREQERLLISDYVTGDSLALHLYESTPRRCAPLSFSQRLKIVVDVARCLYYLHHDRGLPHGNLKPTNIFLTGPDLTAQLTDYGLHRLVTLNGIAEQILNLGALGYRAPELVTAAKPFPSFKADIYSFGVIMMELLTKRSAGDIISGQSGAVDLTDWVRLCAREGRGTECFDRDITGLEEAPRAMDDLLGISLRCILPVNERPNIRTVFDDLCSITI